MKMCATHWTVLRKAISDKGLGHLVKRSSQEVVEMLERQAASQAAPKEDYDPLLAAYFAIFGNFLSNGGAAVLQFDGCPLCEVEGRSGLAADWIDGSTDDQVTICRSRGLVPELN